MHEEDSKIVNVYGDRVAKTQKSPRVAYQRMIITREVTFVCVVCEKTVTQQRYPGRLPRYCGEECEDEGRRRKTLERVKQLRARRKMMEEHNTTRSSPETL
ncbi:MAG TPA: hypothetical protein VEL31_01035 [Ktedonobacteraceae bacterium]|nr:hypothetical protein [Ktedonobacteraceae bacterium]